MRDILEDGKRRFGTEFEQQIQNCTVLVNGKNCTLLRGKRTKVSNADIVAVFNGSFDQESDSEVNLVPEIRTIYRNYGFATKILSCGRFPRIFGQFAVAGTDICTMRPEYLRRLYEHAFTDKRMAGFMEDWRATFGAKTWLEA